jgi:hypothetical protein
MQLVLSQAENQWTRLLIDSGNFFPDVEMGVKASSHASFECGLQLPEYRENCGPYLGNNWQPDFCQEYVLADLPDVTQTSHWTLTGDNADVLSRGIWQTKPPPKGRSEGPFGLRLLTSHFRLSMLDQTGDHRR